MRNGYALVMMVKYGFELVRNGKVNGYELVINSRFFLIAINLY